MKPAVATSPASPRRRSATATRQDKPAGGPEGPGWLDVFAEAYRLRLLRGLEDQLFGCGWGRLAGVDEVGRGALAGPVVAAAVVFDRRCLIPGIDDSKALAAPERERLAAAIRSSALAFAVARVEADVIDRINILEASRRAMLLALQELDPAPECAVVDAVALSGLPFHSLPVVRGDAVSYAVASASILAKVERDRLMVELDRVYPHYGFASHKGYGAPEHLRALATYGPSPVHRLTFGPVLPRRESRRPAARRPPKVEMPLLPLVPARESAPRAGGRRGRP